MSHIHFVVIILELHLEGECIVKAPSFLLERILKVADVLPISVPPDTLAVITVGHLFRVDQRLHTLVVRTLRFHKIDKVEFVSCEFFGVFYPKIEPLGVSSCVMVILEYQIVFVLSYLDSTPQIA